MCTAISVSLKNHYFGRNLDYEHTFGEKVCITPRKYLFQFRNGKEVKNHAAIIGMALPYHGYPLYFDATNEDGLSVAGLHFPDSSMYMQKKQGKDNVASFELIPWILTQCKTIEDAKSLLVDINITNESFDDTLPPTPLHWLIADKEQAITLEQTKEGVKVYENKVGVLTNNPPFSMQMMYLSNFMHVSNEEPRNRFSDKIDLKTYSRGMGSIGIPGDFSSMSRFVKACFVKLNSVYGETEEEAVSQFFHVLYSVYQQKGCVKVGDSYEMTNYTSCCNTYKGIYYYTTYYNSSVRSIDMQREDLTGDTLIVYDIDC